MRKFSKGWIFSAGAVMAVAALGFAYQAEAQSGGSIYNPKSWTAPDYPAHFFPPDAAPYKDIDGHHLHDYVQHLADIARNYRDNGHPQYWGRSISTTAEHEAADWIAQKFKDAGLSDVHVQTVADTVPQWAPKSWKVSLVAGGQTKELTSATPPYGTASTHGKTLDLPVVYVGMGTEADYINRDVRGKIVFFFKGDSVGTNSISGLTYGDGDAKIAIAKGAAAVIVSDMRGSNAHVMGEQFDALVPIFHLGTEDAVAVREAVEKGGADNPPHMTVNLDGAWESGRVEKIAWGTLPGMTDEKIYVTAHHDGKFYGSGDDASGVATEIGLAEHFAKIPKEKRRRTMIFISEAGHHNKIASNTMGSGYGAFGTWWLYLDMERRKVFDNVALFINAEHPAEMIAHGGTTGRTDAAEPMWWYAGGPLRPNLTKIALDAWGEFGVPHWVEPTCPSEDPRGKYTHPTTLNDPHGESLTYRCREPSGEVQEMGEWQKVVPAVAIQASNFAFMHSSEDTPEIVPWTGLQAAVQAYARIIDEVNKLPITDLRRPPELVNLHKRPIPMCEAWLKDSSQRCMTPAQECDAFHKIYPAETCGPATGKF